MPANFMGSPVSFGPDQDQLMEIQRRNALAQSLQEGAMAPLPRSRGPVHPFAGVAKLAKAYYGREQANKAQELAKALGQQQTERRGADASLWAQALQGRPAQPGQVDELAGTTTDPLPAQTPVQSLGQAIPLMSPEMQPMGLQAMMGERQRADQREFQERQAGENRAFRSQEGALAEQRAAERLRQQQTFQADQNRLRAQDQQGLVRMQTDARQQRQPQVIQTADGPMVLGENATAQPIMGPNGPVRPSQGRVGPMTATAQKELIETEEGIQGGQAALSLFQQARQLNDQAMGFTGAGAVASAGSLLPEMIRPGAVDATQNLDNILQTAALPQLKAIFGGMPTEGERKILLDVQGSSSKPPAVRKEIFDRAERAIQARLKFGSDKVKRLREGTYFSGEGLPSIQMQDQPQQQPSYAGPDRRKTPAMPAGVTVRRIQ